MKSYSYEKERQYYSRAWPKEERPYHYLEDYFRCWIKPEEIFREKRVLSIGAGECTYSRLIAEKFNPRYVVASDLFLERMLPAKRTTVLGNLHFIAADCFQLPFQTSAFDVVFGSLILHQLPNFKNVAKEIKRVLMQNGRYLGIEPNPYYPVHLFRFLMGRHSPNSYLLKPDDLRVFEDVGFQVSIQFFHAKFPWTHNRFFGACMGILAQNKPAN